MASRFFKRPLSLAFALALISISAFSVVSSFYFGTNQANAQSLTGVAGDYGVAVSGTSITLAPDQYSLRWINAAELEISFKGSTQKLIFTPKNEEDNGQGSVRDQRNSGVDMDYGIKGYGCYSNAHAGTSVDNQLAEIDIDMDFKVNGNSECVNVGTIDDVPAANPELSIAYFSWVDSGTIQFVGGLGDDVFKQGDPAQPEVFVSTNETGTCRNKLLVDKTANTLLFFDLNDDGANFDGDPPASILAGDCNYRDPTLGNRNRVVPATSNFAYPIANRTANTLAPGSGTISGGDDSIGTVNGDENPTCETSNYGLTWALCPIINGALDATDWFFRVVIEPYLRINPIEVSSSDYVYQIWSSFRTLGNILLVFGLLFIVFGQAIGGGMVDAYTAKKALPRILVAAVLINLSIYIVAILVDISNVIGMGLGQLITAPLKDTGSFNFNLGTAAGGIINATGMLATLLGGGLMALAFAGRGGGATTAGSAAGGALSALGSATVPIIFFIVIPILIAAISVFGTLIIRRGIIIFLAIVSPVAMALYVLPSTEKYAKQWFGLLVKTLMMYPIIIAVFAIADVLGTVILNTGTDGALGGQLASTLAGLMVLFSPMFMIPFTFKLAGGAVSTVYGTLTKSDKLIRGDKHDVHGRYHRWSSSARERGKESVDAGLDRAGGSLGSLGAPGRWAGKGTKGATRRSRERVLAKAYNKHYSGFLRGEIDPTTGATYTDPGDYKDWVKTQRGGATGSGPRWGRGAASSPNPLSVPTPGAAPLSLSTTPAPTPGPAPAGVTVPTTVPLNTSGGVGSAPYGPSAPAPAPTVTSTTGGSPFAAPTGTPAAPAAGAVVTPTPTRTTTTPTPPPAPSGGGSTTSPSGSPAPGSPLPAPTGTPIPPPPPGSGSDPATGALLSAAGEVRAAAGELREAARRTSADGGGSRSGSPFPPPPPPSSPLPPPPPPSSGSSSS